MCDLLLNSTRIHFSLMTSCSVQYPWRLGVLQNLWNHYLTRWQFFLFLAKRSPSRNTHHKLLASLPHMLWHHAPTLDAFVYVSPYFYNTNNNYIIIVVTLFPFTTIFLINMSLNIPSVASSLSLLVVPQSDLAYILLVTIRRCSLSILSHWPSNLIQSLPI